MVKSAVADGDLGCYSSINIAESKGTQTYQTSSTCQDSCSEYAYIAIKNGGECFCLKSKPSSSSALSSSSCNVPCNGYGQQTCGGTNAYTVFAGTGTEGSGTSDSSSSDTTNAAASTSTSKTSTSAQQQTTSKTPTTSATSTTSAPTTSAQDPESSATEESAARTTVIVTASDKGSRTVTTDVTASTSSSGSTSSSSSAASKNSEKKESKSNVGPIVGGVVGGLAGVAIIVALIFFFIRRRNYEDEDEEEEFYDKNNSGTLGGIGLGRGGTGKSSRRTKNPLPLDMPMSNPFDHPSDALADSNMNKLNGGFKNSVDLADPRLNPIMMGRRRLSEGSLADEADYSRKILQVANPDRS